MGVWLGKNILGQLDEIRHELHGTMATYLQVVMPRTLDAQPATAATLGVPHELVEAGESE
jgi:hypothetical protein